MGTAGWAQLDEHCWRQPQLVWETERETGGLRHTNVRKTILAMGQHEEDGSLNTRDLTGLRGLVEILLPLGSVSFAHQ